MDQDGVDELVTVGSWYEGGGMDAAKMEVWIYDYENGQITGTMAYQLYYAGSDSAVMQTTYREATALIHDMDMEGGLTKIGEQYSMATLENGQFSIRRSQLNN